MLFARAYLLDDPLSVDRQIAEDTQRGYSWWRGDYDPHLVYEPGSINTPQELAAAVDRALAAAERSEKIPDPPFMMGRLPGLCAFCAARSYRELAQEIWEDQLQKGWSRWGIIAIFEGVPKGFDQSGSPLFTPKKVLAIADVKAINATK